MAKTNVILKFLNKLRKFSIKSECKNFKGLSLPGLFCYNITKQPNTNTFCIDQTSYNFKVRVSLVQTKTTLTIVCASG